MNEKLLLGTGLALKTIPAASWRRFVAQAPIRSQNFQTKITQTHINIRNTVFEAMIRSGKTVPPQSISEILGLGLEEISQALTLLEQGLIFLSRMENGEINWAFPITVEKTPYRVQMETGKTIYASGSLGTDIAIK